MDPTAPTYLIDSGGQTQTVAPADVPGKLALGWLKPSEEQIRDQQLQEQYGSPGQSVLEGLLSGASAATLGGSDVALRAAGVAPETLAGLEAANPVAHGLGSAAGIGASLLVPGLDVASGPGLAARAGEGAAEAVVPRLAADAISGAPAVAAKALRGAVGLGTEGAVYGGGQLVHEAALGDPNLTAENALATIGLTSIASGALGGAGGLLGGLLGEATAKFTSGDMANKLSDWLGDFEAGRNIKAAGGIQSDITRLVKTKGRDGLMQIAREGGEMGLVSPLSTPAQTLERSTAVQNEAGQQMGELLKAADAKVSDEIGPEIGNVVSRARKEVLGDLQSNPLETGAASNVEQILNDYETKFQQGMSFSDLHGMRRQLDEKIYGLRGAMDPLSSTLKDSLHDIRGIVSDEMKSSLEDAGTSAEWKAANRKYEVASVFQRLAEKGVDREAGNNLVSPTEFLGLLGGGPAGGLGVAAARRHGAGVLGWAARAMRSALGDSAEAVAGKTAEAIAAERQAVAPIAGQETSAIARAASAAPERVLAVAALHDANQAMQGKIDSAVSTLVRGGVKAGKVARGEIAAGVAHEFSDKDLTQALYDKRVKMVRDASSPEALNSAVSKSIGDMQEHAPATAQAFAIAYPRLVQHLASKIPAPPSRGPLGTSPAPTKAEQRDFIHRTNVAQNPLRAVRQAAAGTLTPAGMETLAVGFPALHAAVSQAALSKIAAVGASSVPRTQHGPLSLLTGQRLDAANAGPAIMRNQAVFQRAPTPAPGQIRPTQNGLSKLDVANRSLTPSQASAGRR